jgi:hypothetical protein
VTAKKIQPCPTLDVTSITREKALLRVKRMLIRTPHSQKARQLITLFNLQPEELTEIGLSFEVVKSLERGCLFL